MEPIDILRDQPHSIGPSLFKLHERVVGRIWLISWQSIRVASCTIPRRAEGLVQRPRGREIFCAEGAPQAVRPAKGRHAAIRRNSSSREDGHVPSGGEVCAGEEDLIVSGHGRIGNHSGV